MALLPATSWALVEFSRRNKRTPAAEIRDWRIEPRDRVPLRRRGRAQVSAFTGICRGVRARLTFSFPALHVDMSRVLRVGLQARCQPLRFVLINFGDKEALRDRGVHGEVNAW